MMKNQWISLLLAAVLVILLSACQGNLPDPLESDVEYPVGTAADADGKGPVLIQYVEPYIELLADEIGHLGCQEGYLYLYDEDTGTIQQICDDSYESVHYIAGHLFFAAHKGQLTHYVVETGESRTLYKAENDSIRDIAYANEDDYPVLYLLDGPSLIQYDLRTGKTVEIGVFEEAMTVCVSPANQKLLMMDGKSPFCTRILNLRTGEMVHVETEGARNKFFDGEMPEEEEHGIVNPYPGVRK